MGKRLEQLREIVCIDHNVSDPLNHRRRILIASSLIMSSIALAVAMIILFVQYRQDVKQKRNQLLASVTLHSEFIAAIARFDQVNSQKDHPQGARAATLSQILDAHHQISRNDYPGLGETGEFVLGERRNNSISFLLDWRHSGQGSSRSVAWTSENAEPMRLALSGRSGTVIALDYRGEPVLAAPDWVLIAVPFRHSSIAGRLASTNFRMSSDAPDQPSSRAVRYSSIIVDVPLSSTSSLVAARYSTNAFSSSGISTVPKASTSNGSPMSGSMLIRCMRYMNGAANNASRIINGMATLGLSRNNSKRTLRDGSFGISGCVSFIALSRVMSSRDGWSCSARVSRPRRNLDRRSPPNIPETFGQPM